MPSKSKAQQKFMGMVHSLKKGDTKPSDVSKDVKDAAKSMSKKDAKDYASTKHKGLPNRVKQEILDRLKTEYAFYHTQTRAKKREYDDDNNLGKKKKYSGQPDLEEGMVQPKRGHDYFQLTKDVELDYISGHSGLGLKVTGVRLHNTISQFKGKKGAYIIDYHGRHFYVDMKKRHYMDILSIGNKYQKKLKYNSNYKRVPLAPEFSDWKNYKSAVKKENVQEVGIFPIKNYVKGIIPKGYVNTATPKNKERLKTVIRDLVNTLNHFWKSHNIPYRVRQS
jgi:hypothetical protein